jgi:hypothetical protein
MSEGGLFLQQASACQDKDGSGRPEVFPPRNLGEACPATLHERLQFPGMAGGWNRCVMIPSDDENAEPEVGQRRNRNAMRTVRQKSPGNGVSFPKRGSSAPSGSLAGQPSFELFPDDVRGDPGLGVISRRLYKEDQPGVLPSNSGL